MEDFIHLHVHSYYSILDGQSSIKRLVDKAVSNGMRGMALTDHGDMFGVKELFDYCNKVNGSRKKQGLEPFKPIFGCEMYVAHRKKEQREAEKGDKSGYHLIVLAKNYNGYKNLIKLVSRSWVDGFYMRPRTDREDLERFHEDLIVCSACIAGEVPSKLIRDDIAGAREAIEWYHRVFGDDYYLELQRHEVKDPSIRANRETYPLQQKANGYLIDLAKEYGIKLVCTNDAHFVDEENAEAHDHLLCLSTGKDLDDPSRMLYSKQEWFKTKEEMNEIFADVPEALSNTLEILDKVEFYNIEHEPIMPFFPIPESFGTEEQWRQRITPEELFREFTTDENGKNPLPQAEAEAKVKKLGGVEKLYRIKFEADYLAKLAYDGAHRIYGDPLSDEVEDRIRFELHIMKTMGFPGYFLIVQDFINSARDNLGVMVGPGRGSAAGSVVAYCLGITKIDPLKYDLLFERFLNPDRISLPDIDTDFDDDGRGRVLEWVEDKYGHDKCAHIITYGTMATKNSIKDVARVEKVPLDIVNRLCKAIPDRLPDNMKMSLPNAIRCVPELQEAVVSTDVRMRNTMKYAKMLEGTVRGTGIHACGFIICRDPISDWVPVSVVEDKDNPGHKLHCTQYDGHVIESTGLIKMDFLGLKTLSILKEAVDNIKLTTGKVIDLDKIPIDDPVTYKLYQEGRTVGTFQFESAGMQKYLRELHPTVFEDLIAMNALYRPGPMDYIPSFIARKNGREPITYDIPCMEKYLKDTYGITVDAMKPKFINGGMANGHDPKILEKIWADWEKFASYAFNKSHAACYSWVAFQTGYLKANYPAEYMAAVMSRNVNNISEVTKLMDECKSMGIPTLGPDINESWQKFSANKHGEIRFGLAAIKGMGTAAAAAMIEEREQNGPYKSIFDVVERVNLSACNRKALESMALSGGFDSFGIRREQYFALNNKGEMFLDTLMRYGQLYQQEQQQARNSLFGDMGGVEIATPPVPVMVEEWSNLERLNKERDLVGIYISAHPLDEYSIVLKGMCNTRCSELADREALAKKESFQLGGIVTQVREKTTKRGDPCGFVTIEDFEGSGELALFGQEWANWRGMMVEGYTLYIKGKCAPLHPNSTFLSMQITSVQFMSQAKDENIEKLTITFDADKIDDAMVTDLTTLLDEHRGSIQLYFQINNPEGGAPLMLRSRNRTIDVNRELLNYLDTNPAFEYRIN